MLYDSKWRPVLSCCTSVAMLSQGPRGLLCYGQGTKLSSLLLGHIILRVFHCSKNWVHSGRMFLEGSAFSSSSAPSHADILGEAGIFWRNRYLVECLWESICLASGSLLGKRLTTFGINASTVARDWFVWVRVAEEPIPLMLDRKGI